MRTIKLNYTDNRLGKDFELEYEKFEDSIEVTKAVHKGTDLLEIISEYAPDLLEKFYVACEEDAHNQKYYREEEEGLRMFDDLIQSIKNL